MGCNGFGHEGFCFWFHGFGGFFVGGGVVGWGGVGAGEREVFVEVFAPLAGWLAGGLGMR